MWLPFLNTVKIKMEMENERGMNDTTSTNSSDLHDMETLNKYVKLQQYPVCIIWGIPKLLLYL